GWLRGVHTSGLGGGGDRPGPLREPYAGARGGRRGHGAEPGGRRLDVHTVAAGRGAGASGPELRRPGSRPPNQADSSATMAAAGAAAGSAAPVSGASSPPLLSARRNRIGPTVWLTAMSASSRPWR